MKIHAKKPIFLSISLIVLITIPLYLLMNSHSIPPSASILDTSDLRGFEECDIFSGKWVHHPNSRPYYNANCRLIVDKQNCMKFGRPDKDYIKWRWRPHDCELPFFSAVRFLKVVSGKKMAFVGDSVGRNQMESLACLLARVAYPEDISHRYASDTAYFKRWFYPDYGFTLAALWSPFLVKASDADPTGHSPNSLMNLYLDQADDAWVSQIENFDYVIISAGHWFFRPVMYYVNGEMVGCSGCSQENVTALSEYYGYKMAFQTAFKTLQNLKRYNGITILRTFSPSHFENGRWNTGGICARTWPFMSGERELEGFTLEFYMIQVEELRKAEKEGEKKGLKFLLLATTEAMLLRPDGHPNHYGHAQNKNVSVADCVHWCLPGPIDTWNELLLYMLRREAQKSLYAKLSLRNIFILLL